MRVIQVFNRRKAWGGEDNSINDTVEICNSRNVETKLWIRDVAEIRDRLMGKIRVFFSGIYSLESARIMKNLIREFRPDVVEFHNLYPQLSPSVLRTCWRMNIPTIWHPHDQKFLCPTGMHLYEGTICEKCCGGREYWCILQNCRGNIFESIGYSLWTWTARNMNMFNKYVTLFVVWSEYLKNRLVKAGYPVEKIVVVPHPINIPCENDISPTREYVGYMGRISPEKGVDTLVTASKSLPDIPICIAGDYNGMPELVEDTQETVKFIGWCDGVQKKAFYNGARFVVIPSIWFEVLPTVALEALSYGVPIIGARTGGIPEIVIDGVTGLLFDPGDSNELAEKIDYLWERPKLCADLGQAGRKLVAERYCEQSYFDSLMQVFHRAIDSNKRKISS